MKMGPTRDQSEVVTKNSISTKLFRYVFSIYLVVAIVVTGFHMVFEYKRVEKNIIEDINIIYLNSNPTMAIALWEADRDQMLSILNGMIKSPTIVGVKISDPSGEYVLQKGEIIDAAHENVLVQETQPGTLIRDSASELFGYRYPIINSQDEQDYEIGNMTLYSSPSVVFSRVKSSYIFILINAVIKSVVLWLVFLWFSRLLLRRPLYTLTAAAREIDMDNLENIQIDIEGTSKNSGFFVSARKHRTDDCTDAGGRVKQDARTENRSVYGIHEDSSTELTPQEWHKDVPLTDLRMESRKKTIFRGALDSKGRNELTILADTLNDMIQKLLKARQELDKNRAQLEERVEQRTAELTQANTRLKQEEEALRQAKQHADAANRSKSLFLANMSHELRTPLNIILGFSQLMFREQGASEEQRKNLKTIMQSGEYLLELINDVLELSKIEVGKVELSSDSFDLHKLIANLESMFRLNAEQKGLAFQASLAPEVPKYIRTDRSKLSQVLINLLSNSVKFTEQGKIQLEVNCTEQQPRQEDNCQIHFAVSDTGIGIPKNEQEKIFDIFSQVEAEQPDKTGTGLGLAISRKFVELMGGNLSVESHEAQGSRFDFTIAVEVTESPDQEDDFPNRRVVGLVPGQATVRLLVAEDNPGSRSLLVTLLRSVGFEVREAANGEQAIEQWQQWQPHLIWMDLRMPEVDGLQAINEIRKLPGGDNTRIIALTAHAFEEDRRVVLENGGDDFLRKPFSETEMFHLLEKHLGVQFEYLNTENDPMPSNQSMTHISPTISTFLRTLPEDVRRSFQRALSLGEVDRIGTIIREISASNAEAGQILKSLADDFAYDEITELINSAKTEDET